MQIYATCGGEALLLETFFNSIQSVLVILLLTAVGYFCAAKGWLGVNEKKFISKLLMNLAIPIMCVYSLRSRLTLELLQDADRMLLVPLICVLGSFALSYVAGKLLRLPRRTMGVFMMMCGLSNTLFIGYPMCTEIFGESATPYVMMYYLISTSFTQLLGLSLVRWSGGTGGFTWKTLLNFLKAPTVIGIFAAIALVLLDINPPALFMSFGKYMNQLVTPLALLVTGEIIYSIGLRNLHMDKLMWVVSLFRFVIAPMLCILLCRTFSVDDFATGVFVVQAAMPVVTQTVVAATEYGADERCAAQGAAITTLLSFLAIPALTVFLS